MHSNLVGVLGCQVISISSSFGVVASDIFRPLLLCLSTQVSFKRLQGGTGNPTGTGGLQERQLDAFSFYGQTAGLERSERRTQREVSEVADITDVTIRNRYKELAEELGLEWGKQ
ncbi:hypothetical protein AKJ66_02340 [candidate division MSBL1 archaeon SCGC-AAA259E22]|uniref:Transcription factor TFIIB cyclin-like domain-containing protein n=1 Tax=candidate division MSBL1 archaeon SCGC-AAA259E22 TaxID=1698265 RepID=A0A133UGU8_9EURY|nr:hypothetical protein AKJ66_02340 [candidate division MSBL1 archaeon SCGC-AAA259E22]